MSSRQCACRQIVFIPMKFLYLLAIFLVIAAAGARAQIYSASPSNWLYPYGNSEATRQQVQASGVQSFDSVGVKWISSDIYGDVQPLVGNIVNRPRIIPSLPWAANEIAAVIGGNLVVLGGDGRTVASEVLPPFVKNVSVLFDSTALLPDAFTIFPVIMGLEVVEHEAPDDSAARSYIAGFSTNSSRIEIIKRLAADLRPYSPNNSASIMPVYGRSDGTDMTVYTAVNMSDPQVFVSGTTEPPFFRGLAAFDTRDFRFPFPRPDVLDVEEERYTVGPEVSVTPPSITASNGTAVKMLLPCFPSPTLQLPAPIDNPYTDLTFPHQVYLFDLELNDNGIAQGPAWQTITSVTVSQRPRIRPVYVKLTDAGAGGIEKTFILVAEEYSGRDNSAGTAALHLYDEDGVPLTFTPPAADPATSSFMGTRNHHWSIATGDIDGFASNEALPYFPNNPGNEIVVTSSSPDFAVAGSSLLIMRYRTGTRIEKLTTRRDSLYYLDTVATSRMGGWVAAVNDFDAAPDGKAEIFVVDGTTLRVLRLRNYDDVRFRLGYPLDTVATYPFGTESISAIAVSDVDGDGLNDILVTTSQRTYLLGKSLLGALDVIDPVVENVPPTPFCNGDTIRLRWVNYIGGNPTVNIYFQPYSGSNPSGPRRLVAQDVQNKGDSIVYNYVVDTRAFSGDGRFIVESTLNALQRDSSAILRILQSSITLDLPTDGDVFRVGETVPLAGTTVCFDEVQLEYAIGSSTASWQRITRIPVNPDGTYSHSFVIPCLSLFNCLAADVDSVVRFRAIGLQNNANAISDTTAERFIIVRPDTLIIAEAHDHASAQRPACPDRTFEWNPLLLPTGCDMMAVGISLDSGKTFTLYDTVSATEAMYLWRVPVSIPDTIVLRFCCLDGCARTDIRIDSARPRYIQIVAPNPFDPLGPQLGAKPGVNVIYALDRAARVTITIFDQANRIVARPVRSEDREAGIVYCDSWTGFIEGTDRAAGNGMYYLVLETSDGKREVYPVYVAKGY